MSQRGHVLRVLGVRATGCICAKRLLVDMNEGTCVWCGRGDAEMKRSGFGGRPTRLRRLPRNLGGVSGRPDQHLANVVWLDDRRNQWKVPPVPDEPEEEQQEAAA